MSIKFRLFKGGVFGFFGGGGECRFYFYAPKSCQIREEARMTNRSCFGKRAEYCFESTVSEKRTHCSKFTGELGSLITPITNTVSSL